MSEQNDVRKEEERYLQSTISEMKRQIEELEKIPRYFGDNITEQALDAMREEQKYHLKKSLPEPYFGRMDFLEHGKTQPMPVYIGKTGVTNDKTKHLLVIDWRAPIASLFYSFTGGEDTSVYQSPDGTVEGRIDLKRNIVIRDQKIQRIVDSYERGKEHLGVTDEFLLYRLGENKDHRLRDIVSTIQEEQNQIIRSPKDQAYVIQGVAGSGKTTVALHRIAYLLYEYREQIRASRMMIFAPSRMFLDYISNVLPELGVSGIGQTTYSQWVLQQLDDDIQLQEQREQWRAWFAVENKRHLKVEQSSGRFKGSIAFAQMIESALQHYERESTPVEDFEPWPGVTLKAAEIQQWLKYDYGNLAIRRKRERILTRIKKWIEKKLESVWDRKLQKELKKKSTTRLKTYLKSWPELTAFEFYQQIFAHPKYAHVSVPELDSIPQEIKKNTSRYLKNKSVAHEDLAALLYIHDRLHGNESKQLFDHIVIDEAQDFSPFQVLGLLRRVRNESITILGDLAQSIHTNQGITDWKEFLQLFTQRAGYFELQRSYRSTMEIIHFANQILAGMNIGVEPAVPVFRSGEPVKVMYTPKAQTIETICSNIEHYKQQHVSSIAVIGRTEEDCEKIHQQLLEVGIQATLIDAKNQEYSGGISVLPIYLAKGLEFDAVIIIDVDEHNYGNHAEDAKLLYVGCTRALHHLALLHGKHPSALLTKIADEYYSKA